MIRKFALALLAAATFTLSSCLQMEQKTAVNPDGTGRLDMTVTLDLGPLAGLMQQQGIDENADPGRELLVGILSQTKGIDVWKDAKATKGADGKVTVTAVGYFKDVAKVVAGNPLGELGGGGGAEIPDVGAFKSSKDADGNWILEAPLEMGNNGKKEDAGEKKPKMTDEELEAKVEEMRQQFGAMKPMMEQMLGGLKIRQTVEVGGAISDSGLFKKDGEKSATMEVSFGKMFGAMEKLLEDDETAKKIAQFGGSNPTDLLKSNDPEVKEIGEKMLQAIVGGKGKPRLVIKPGEPLFDYAAEAEKAKAGQSDDLKKLLKEAAEKAKNKGESDEGEKGGKEDPKKKAA